MSKISKQKALEEYPKVNPPYSTDVEREIDAKRAYYRTAYIVGYDQAMQDFLEKAEKFLSEKVSDYFWWNIDEYFVDFDKEDCLEQFKNYMKNE